jgi:hypothetical protein
MRLGILMLAISATAAMGFSQMPTAQARSTQVVRDKSTQVVPILLVAAGEKAEITPIAGSDTYRLRMLETNDLITWFTDRPARKTGLMLAHDLANNWTRIGFKSVPPNSALVLRNQGQVQTFTVETTKPSYANGVLAFTVRPLEKNVKTLPANAQTASLFIDDLVVPTTSNLWNYHTLIPATAQNQYIAKLQIQKTAVNPSDSNLIHSFPASALIAHYSVPHLSIANNGINLTSAVSLR